jgi:hypothetical protein
MVAGTIFTFNGVKCRVTVSKNGCGFSSVLDIYGFGSLASLVKKEGWMNVASTHWDKPDVMLHKKTLLDNIFYSDSYSLLF